MMAGIHTSTYSLSPETVGIAFSPNEGLKHDGGCCHQGAD